MTYPIAPNGIFWTLQGEGALQGEPMAFVRLAGCSVGCPQCDTDYRVDRRLTPEEIVAEVRTVVPAGFRWPWVWITGGEPTDHDLKPLVSSLRKNGLRVALATSGVKAITTYKLDWLSVSPHTPAIMQRFGSELKIVPGLNGMTLDAFPDMRSMRFQWKFAQPLSESRASLDACIAFVQTHPGWRLTTQAHKGWGLP